MWFKILRLCLLFPRTFLNNVKLSNYLRLIQALQEEPLEQILSNLKLFLENDGKSKQINQDQQSELHRIATFPFKTTFLLVSHEATLTGAPLIIKQLGENWSLIHSINIIFLLCKPGEICDDFKSIGPTLLINNYDNVLERDRHITFLLEQILPVCTIDKCYVNSAESRFILPQLKKLVSAPIISLIHELGNYYPKGSWDIIDQYSDHIVFPAQFVRDKAMINHQFTSSITIAGQGLLKPEILSADRHVMRAKIRSELKLPDNAKIILGCGSTIARKGIDLFVYSAISVLNKLDIHSRMSTFFIWVGDAPYQDIQLWMNRAIKDANYEDRILFIGSLKDTIPYFVGSDIFFMPSKGDPYPCVVQEAAAAGLPIVGFEGSGGWPEYLPDRLKHMIPSGDVALVSEKIIEISKLTRSSAPYSNNFSDYSDNIRLISTITSTL